MRREPIGYPDGYPAFVRFRPGGAQHVQVEPVEADIVPTGRPITDVDSLMSTVLVVTACGTRRHTPGGGAFGGVNADTENLCGVCVSALDEAAREWLFAWRSEDEPFAGWYGKAPVI